MKILILNGPNMNMLGIREPEVYGRETYEDLVKICREAAERLAIETEFFQSNHEGALIDRIQEAYDNIDGIVFNPGGYSHTSVAILDALRAVGIPTVEVHISDPDQRENYRKVDLIAEYAVRKIAGRGIAGYIEAMEFLVSELG